VLARRPFLLQSDQRAVTAAGAFVDIHEPWVGVDLDPEVALLSLNVLDGAAGEELDVDVPADLDQLG
jgi:hypothetical protein